MFDYQAGEKFKVTLIMVGFAGVMAGMFFTLLLMPTPDAQPQKHRARPAWMNNPDANGGKMVAGLPAYGSSADANQGRQFPDPGFVDPPTAQKLIQGWLPLAWDLSAGSAKGSQEKAIAYMTTECANAYRQNIWTSQLAQQIEQTGIRSTFKADKVSAGPVQGDGSVVVFVEAQQVLTVPNKGSKTRPVRVEYLIKKTPEGLRISGISEGGQSG
jgi:hypothetical protein